MSGSAVLSDREYAKGEFEFKIRPSLTSGIVTTVGLANDGTQQQNPFFQVVFNMDKYGSDSLGVQLGGITDLFGTR